MSTKDFGKVAVLLGGRSAEREVSLKSGAMVLRALRARGIDAHPFDPQQRGLAELIAEKFDRVFIALHGRYGEDGTIQGALELLGIPYTGSGVLASALAMDKWRTKLVWQAAGIPTPRCELLTPASDLKAVAARLSLPIMVKPANEGSSIGMSKVRAASGLDEAYAFAANYDSVVIAEQFIDGIELTAAVLGGEALPLIRLETPREFYDYEAKYLEAGSRLIIPAPLSDAQAADVTRLAIEAFQAVDCAGMARVDFLLAGDSQKIYVNEINTIPGFTTISMYAKLWAASGLEYPALLDRLVDLAFARHTEKQQLRTSSF